MKAAVRRSSTTGTGVLAIRLGACCQFPVYQGPRAPQPVRPLWPLEESAFAQPCARTSRA